MRIARLRILVSIATATAACSNLVIPGERRDEQKSTFLGPLGNGGESPSPWPIGLFLGAKGCLSWHHALGRRLDPHPSGRR